jgi:hypothetical protein
LPWAKIEFVFLLLFSPFWTHFRYVSMYVPAKQVKHQNLWNMLVISPIY